MINKTFNKSVRLQLKASILIEGLSGSGKSGLALMIANALTKDNADKIYAIDTENKSLDLYTDLPTTDNKTFKPFNKVDLAPEDGYAPSNYITLRDMAIKAGAEVVIFDSITHAWQSEGGVLSMVNSVSANNKGDKYAAWRDPRVAGEKNMLLDMLRCSNCHMISTVRIKEKFAPELDESTGKTKIVSLGEQELMQDDAKYEPDLVLRMVEPGSTTSYPVVTVIKSRYPLFTKDFDYEITPTVLENMRKFLEEGADPKAMLEQQRLDYIDGVKRYLTDNPGKKAIWQIIKQQAGYEKTKVEDMSLDILKSLFIQLTV